MVASTGRVLRTESAFRDWFNPIQLAAIRFRLLRPGSDAAAPGTAAQRGLFRSEIGPPPLRGRAFDRKRAMRC